MKVIWNQCGRSLISFPNTSLAWHCASSWNPCSTFKKRAKMYVVHQQLVLEKLNTRNDAESLKFLCLDSLKWQWDGMGYWVPSLAPSLQYLCSSITPNWCSSGHIITFYYTKSLKDKQGSFMASVMLGSPASVSGHSKLSLCSSQTGRNSAQAGWVGCTLSIGTAKTFAPLKNHKQRIDCLRTKYNNCQSPLLATSECAFWSELASANSLHSVHVRNCISFMMTIYWRNLQQAKGFAYYLAHRKPGPKSNTQDFPNVSLPPSRLPSF